MNIIADFYEPVFILLATEWTLGVNPNVAGRSHLKNNAIIRGDAWHEYADGIKWNHFPRYWPFVRGIHRLPVNSLQKD